MVPQSMSAEDVMDQDTHYSVMSDTNIQSYLFMDMAEEMQQREAKDVAALHLQEDMAKWGRFAIRCLCPIHLGT